MISGNNVTLLQTGEAFFPAIETAFHQAKNTIFLETYIFENDATGKRIVNALKDAAKRGIAVHVLIDGFGSRSFPREVVHEMRKVGIKIFKYRPQISPWTFQRKRLRRLHRKIVVVDREIAFVGGINIIDDVDQAGQTPPRFDFAVAVKGPLVRDIDLSVRRLWAWVAWKYWRGGQFQAKVVSGPSTARGSIRAAFLERDNFRHRRDIESAYLQAVEQAKSEIVLANAYFLPGFHFRHALIRAANRGVRVVLLMQGRVEYPLLHYASRALYGHLLDAGIEIFEYQESFMHAKVAVIDGQWATVGSSNIDPFSLLLSREANVVVDDQSFALNLKQRLELAMINGAQRIRRTEWKNQPVRLRFVSWLSYGLVRLLMGLAGYVHENNLDGIDRNQRSEA